MKELESITGLYAKQLSDEIMNNYPKRLVVDSYRNLLDNMKHDIIENIDEEKISKIERIMCSYLKNN